MLQSGWTVLQRHGVLCGVLALISVTPAFSQKGGGGGGHPAPAPSPAPVRPTGGSGSSSSNSPTPFGTGPTIWDMGLSNPRQVDFYNRMRRQEQQKRVMKDSDKLVALTAEYQHMMQEKGQSVETDRKLRDIEKLARDVRTTLVQ